MNDFVVHACEQSLRFSNGPEWSDLSEKIRMQFSFNVGVMALGLDLTKEEGYDALHAVCQGQDTIQKFHQHVRVLLAQKGVSINEDMVNRPF